MGLFVYHPMLQMGDTPYWHTGDYTGINAELLDDDERDMLAYDEGTVLSTFYQDFEGWPKEDLLRVRFGDGSWAGLHYSPCNIWTLRPGA